MQEGGESTAVDRKFASRDPPGASSEPRAPSAADRGRRKSTSVGSEAFPSLNSVLMSWIMLFLLMLGYFAAACTLR